VLAGWPLVRRRGLRLLQVLDAAVPGLALGIAIGRIGDVAMADHLGKPTLFALGYRCPPVAVVGETVGSPCPPGAVVHLAALYDLVGALLVFGLLAWVGRRPRWEGRLTLAFTIGYGLVRLVEDGFRTDKRLLLGLDASQLTAAVAVAVAIPSFCSCATAHERLPRPERHGAAVRAGLLVTVAPGGSRGSPGGDGGRPVRRPGGRPGPRRRR
jgi:phosphatidylglycerol:prolipoprotein diacylglycerol transferase